MISLAGLWASAADPARPRLVERAPDFPQPPSAQPAQVPDPADNWEQPLVRTTTGAQLRPSSTAPQYVAPVVRPAIPPVRNRGVIRQTAYEGPARTPATQPPATAPGASQKPAAAPNGSRAAANAVPRVAQAPAPAAERPIAIPPLPAPNGVGPASPLGPAGPGSIIGPIPGPFAPGQVPPAPTEPGAGPPRPQYRIPLVGPADPNRIELTPNLNGRISLIVREAPLNEVLSALALQQGVNIVSAEDITMRISVTVRDVTFEDALTALTSVAGYTWTAQHNIIQVTSLVGAQKVAPHAQGRMVQVINLNFVAASDVEAVARGLLSPVGQVFATMSTQTDHRKTRDVIVVEDLPPYVARVAEYIAQVDHPPRQVLIEAHILEVTLSDDTKFGVNWDALARVDKTNLTWKTLGLAGVAPPTALFTIDGQDLDVTIEAIKSTTDSKMLATPRLLVLNGQQARLQIGKKSGYLVTTTTQTSTLQNVEFLNTGVLLTIRPTISDDDHVLLSVKPEVSDGGISPQTGLPETTTTEVETNILLGNGQGIVIGGLIRESDTDKQTKVPILGDMWLVGRLFQKRSVVRDRKEIVVALVPRVMPYDPEFVVRDKTDLRRATTPLLGGPLQPVSRPWEPKLPDAMFNPRRWRVDRVPNFFKNLRDPYPLPPEHYFPAPSDERPWISPLEPAEGPSGPTPGQLPVQAGIVPPAPAPIPNLPATRLPPRPQPRAVPVPAGPLPRSTNPVPQGPLPRGTATPLPAPPEPLPPIIGPA